MVNKSLPLFESVAAVFGIAVVAILVALPSSGASEQEAQERVLRDHLGQSQLLAANRYTSLGRLAEFHSLFSVLGHT